MGERSVTHGKCNPEQRERRLYHYKIGMEMLKRGMEHDRSVPFNYMIGADFKMIFGNAHIYF